LKIIKKTPNIFRFLGWNRKRVEHHSSAAPTTVTRATLFTTTTKSDGAKKRTNLPAVTTATERNLSGDISDLRRDSRRHCKKFLNDFTVTVAEKSSSF
jgi:hypothetical protein